MKQCFTLNNYKITSGTAEWGEYEHISSLTLTKSDIKLIAQLLDLSWHHGITTKQTERANKLAKKLLEMVK